MSAPDDRTRSADPMPLAPSPGRAARETTADDAAPVSEPPRKQHGDALLDGSGSRQGTDTDPARDAAPHE